MSLASLLRQFSPSLRTKWLQNQDATFRGQTPRHIFSEIYAQRLWGKDSDSREFCSGHGSRFPEFVEPYVAAVSEFLESFETAPDVVDLGCGDYNVGRQLRGRCGNYIACDVVPDLIERNSSRFQDLGVDFRCVDIVTDPLPVGDVVIIRQVLQHLSNRDIAEVVRKIDQYRYLVLTEFVPNGEFVPNLDQPTGIFSRIARGIPSGVVLTAAPFSIDCSSERIIATTSNASGLLNTIVYALN